jgi:hypothetical protein
MPCNRRQLLTGTTASALFWIAPLAHATDEAVLRDGDSDAQSIDYSADARKVDRARFPQYAPGQTCQNCKLFTPINDARLGSCEIVFGKLVATQAWCSSWDKKA